MDVGFYPQVSHAQHIILFSFLTLSGSVCVLAPVLRASDSMSEEASRINMTTKMNTRLHFLKFSTVRVKTLCGPLT